MINISSQPAAGSLQAAYLPIPYAVRQTGVAGDLPPALDVTPINDDNETETYAVGVNSKSGSTSIYKVDLSGVAGSLINKTAGLPSQAATLVRELPGSVVPISVRFDEYATGPDGLLAKTGQSKTSSTCYVIDAYRRAEDADQTVGAFGRFTSPRFLTRRSRRTALPITIRDTLSIFNAGATGDGAPTSSSGLTVVFTFYNSSDAVISSNNLSLPGSVGSMVQFAMGPADLVGIGVILSTELASVDYYTVQVGRVGSGIGQGDDLDATGDTLTVFIERGPSNAMPVYFYNSYGAWEMALFSENAVQQYDLTGSQYSRLNRDITEQRRSRWAVQVTSSTDTIEEADAMLDLANSTAIYCTRAGRPIPVTLTATVLPVAFGPGSNGSQPFQFTLRAAIETASQRTY